MGVMLNDSDSENSSSEEDGDDSVIEVGGSAPGDIALDWGRGRSRGGQRGGGSALGRASSVDRISLTNSERGGSTTGGATGAGGSNVGARTSFTRSALQMFNRNAHRHEWRHSADTHTHADFFFFISGR